jgi:hypothetical protein
MHRPQNARLGLYNLPSRKVQQVLYVVCRQPVLQKRGRFEPEIRRHLQHWTPKVVKETHDQPRARLGYRLQPLEHRLHVRQVIYQVSKENVIELLQGGVFRCIGHLEFDLGMALACQHDHRWAKVHAQAASRLHRRQQIPQAAAHL